MCKPQFLVGNANFNWVYFIFYCHGIPMFHLMGGTIGEVSKFPKLAKINL